MAAVYECCNCNVITTEPTEICVPSGVDIRCDYGRDPEEQRGRMCRPIRARTDTECDMCGRPTLEGTLVCMPTDSSG